MAGLVGSSQVHEVNTTIEVKGRNVSYNGQAYPSDNGTGLPVPHGKGLMRWDESKSYNGSWLKGVQEGKGYMKYRGGDTYEGMFKKGYKHGFGIFKKGTANTQYVGVWKKNEFYNGIMYKNGDMYEIVAGMFAESLCRGSSPQHM